MAAALIEIRLPHPVPNRLRAWLELLRQLLRTASRSYQLNHSPPVLRCILCMALGHRGSPSLSPLRHCPLNRVNSIVPLKEEDAYPAEPQDAYGWEKLITERLCTHYREDYAIETRNVRFHNIFGPYGTWEGGREKAPAALCRKLAHAKLTGYPRSRDLGRRRADSLVLLYRRLCNWDLQVDAIGLPRTAQSWSGPDGCDKRTCRACGGHRGNPDQPEACARSAGCARTQFRQHQTARSPELGAGDFLGGWTRAHLRL